MKNVQLGADEIKGIALVIEALEKLPRTVKIRGVRFDVRTQYGWGLLARVRLTGSRSTWDNTINVTEVKPA